MGATQRALGGTAGQLSAVLAGGSGLLVRRQPNPVVYFNDQDTMYHWGPFADSVQSFLLATVLENLEEDADPDVMEDPVEIQKVLSEAGMDFQRI